MLWSVAEKRSLVPLKGHTDWVRTVAFSPDDKWLASGGNDFKVILWRLSETESSISATSVYTFDDHKAFVYDVAFKPDSSLLASAGGDCMIRMWNVLGEPENPPMPEPMTKTVRAVAFSRLYQTMLASGSAGITSTVVLWDVANHQDILPLLTGHVKDVTSIAFSPITQTLASSSYDHTVILWNANNHTQIHLFPEHSAKVHSVAFSPDGRILASGAGERDSAGNIVGSRIILWDMTDYHMLCEPIDLESEVNSIAFSPDGRLIASGEVNGTITLWSVQWQ